MTDQPPTPEDKNRQVTMLEAASLYGFNHKYLSELARKGKLQATKFGNTWVTTPAAIEDYIRNRKKRGAYREDITLND